MQDTMEASLASSTADENNAIKSFDGLMAVKIVVQFLWNQIYRARLCLLDVFISFVIVDVIVAHGINNCFCLRYTYVSR